MKAMLVGVALLAACGSRARVELTNDTGDAITAVRVEVKGSTSLQIDRLATGATKAWTFEARRDGCFSITATLAAGRTIASPCLDYTTAGDTRTHRFKIKADGTIE